MGCDKIAVDAVKIPVECSIMLHSGAWFDFRSPSCSAFTIEDIAHGLAHICKVRGPM